MPKRSPLTPEQIAAINSVPAIIQELAQSLVAQDDVAALIAGVNIVGKWLELQERQTVALEQIASCVDSYAGPNKFVVRSD